MPTINEHFLNLNASDLFAEIRRRTDAFTSAHPGAALVNLGIGDVTQPLAPGVVRAIHEAAEDMARAETFKGYGPYAGDDFLRAAIAEHDFAARGLPVAPDEVFVSDGGKSDSANLQEIFATDCVVAVMDPVYPVYADANVVAGRTGRADESGRYAGLVYLPCTAENDFQPALPDRHADVIDLCYPNWVRLRPERRGLFPAERVRIARGRRGSGHENPARARALITTVIAWWASRSRRPCGGPGASGPSWS